MSSCVNAVPPVVLVTQLELCTHRTAMRSVDLVTRYSYIVIKDECHRGNADARRGLLTTRYWRGDDDARFDRIHGDQSIKPAFS